MNSSIKLSATPPPTEVEAELGRRLEALRLARNVTQAQLAEQAGVARRTITRLETGLGVSLDTFIRVLRALGLAERLMDLVPDASVQPIERVRRKARVRQRARPGAAPKESKWQWGEGPGRS